MDVAGQLFDDDDARTALRRKRGGLQVVVHDVAVVDPREHRRRRGDPLFGSDHLQAVLALLEGVRRDLASDDELGAGGPWSSGEELEARDVALDIARGVAGVFVHAQREQQRIFRPSDHSLSQTLEED